MAVLQAIYALMAGLAVGRSQQQSLWRLFQQRPDASSGGRIVVCVCTLDRNEALIRCLRSLVGQKLPNHVDVQVLVVDNSANASANAAVRAFMGRGMPVTYVHEIERCIPAARNAALQALQEAQPAWIAFIDDDEVAPPDWLARMLQIGLAQDADVVHSDVISIDARDIEHAAQYWRGPDVTRSANEQPKRRPTMCCSAVGSCVSPSRCALTRLCAWAEATESSLCGPQTMARASYLPKMRQCSRNAIRSVRRPIGSGKGRFASAPTATTDIVRTVGPVYWRPP